MRNNSPLSPYLWVTHCVCCCVSRQTNTQRGKGRNTVSVSSSFVLNFLHMRFKIVQPSSTMALFVLITNWVRKTCVQAKLPRTKLWSAYVDSPASLPKLIMKLLWNWKFKINLWDSRVIWGWPLFLLQSPSVLKNTSSKKRLYEIFIYRVRFQFCTPKRQMPCHGGFCETGSYNFALWVGCYLPLKLCQYLQM